MIGVTVVNEIDGSGFELLIAHLPSKPKLLLLL